MYAFEKRVNNKKKKYIYKINLLFQLYFFINLKINNIKKIINQHIAYSTNSRTEF